MRARGVEGAPGGEVHEVHAVGGLRRRFAVQDGVEGVVDLAAPAVGGDGGRQRLDVQVRQLLAGGGRVEPVEDGGSGSSRIVQDAQPCSRRSSVSTPSTHRRTRPSMSLLRSWRTSTEPGRARHTSSATTCSPNPATRMTEVSMSHTVNDNDFQFKSDSVWSGRCGIHAHDLTCRCSQSRARRHAGDMSPEHRRRSQRPPPTQSTPTARAAAMWLSPTVTTWTTCTTAIATPPMASTTTSTDAGTVRARWTCLPWHAIPGPVR